MTSQPEHEASLETSDTKEADVGLKDAPSFVPQSEPETLSTAELEHIAKITALAQEALGPSGTFSAFELTI